jgi:GNAT superfamily N-acetyltransferase
MSDSALRSVGPADVLRDSALGGALLALNNAHAQELSWLEAERLEYLISEAFLARRIGELDAFLLAFDQDAQYDSPNFIWFRARYPRFVYVDRIVVAPSARGRGCARRLYADLSNTPSAPDTIASSARSTPFRQMPLRMPSMRRWVLSKSAPPASMTEAGRFATCRKPYIAELTLRARSRGISPPHP